MESKFTVLRISGNDLQEHKMPLSTWQHRANSFPVYFEDIQRALNIGEDRLLCTVCQTPRCRFYCDKSGDICFDLQVLRFYLRFNAVLLSDFTQTNDLYDAIVFLYIAQEQLNENLSLMSVEAMQLYSNRIQKCLISELYWKDFDMIKIFRLIQIQSIYLIGHEAFHYAISTDAARSSAAVSETRAIIGGLPEIPEIFTNDLIMGERLIEECACDRFSVGVTFDIALKINVNPIDAAMAVLFSTFNQYLLSLIKSIAIIPITDDLLSSSYLQDQFNFWKTRISCLNTIVVQCLEQKGYSELVLPYTKMCAEYFNKWSKKMTTRLTILLEEFKDAILERYSTWDKIPYYMKLDDKIENGEDIVKIEEDTRRRLLGLWDAFDTVNIDYPR